MDDNLGDGKTATRERLISLVTGVEGRRNWKRLEEGLFFFFLSFLFFCMVGVSFFYTYHTQYLSIFFTLFFFVDILLIIALHRIALHIYPAS